MINEVALVLLFGLFGWKITLIYLVTGLTIAFAAGWLIGRFRMENYVEEWVYKSMAGSVEEEKLARPDRISAGWLAVKDIVGKVWIFVLMGIAVGAFIHGFAPENFLASVMGKKAWRRY